MFRINSKGFVGIGTSPTSVLDPEYRLSVNGKIRAKGLRVQSSGWADFVFEPGYKLKSLSEVDQYIKTNRHLPEMPAAAQVIKDGNDVGETQIKLLQKIEELTLYVIEQDKRLTELEQKNKSLETQNKQIDEVKKQLEDLKQLITKKK